MNFQEAKKRINNISWYQQGAATKPFYVSYPWHACSLIKIQGKKIPLKYEILAYIKDDFMDDYISKKSLEEVGAYYLEKQKKDREFIFKLIDKWHKDYLKPYLRINLEIMREDFLKYKNKKIFDLFRDFTNAYLRVWQESIFLDAFDYFGEKILKEAFAGEGKNIKKNDLEILLSPPKPSFLQKERLDILKLAEAARRDKKDFQEISSRYYWLRNDFAEINFLSADHFVGKVKELFKSKNKLRKEKEMRLWLKGLKNKKEKISKKYKLSKNFKNITDFLAILGNFRDERKTYAQMAGNVLEKFAGEFSRRSGLSRDVIEYAFFWEMKNVFRKDKKLIAEIKSRRNGWFYCVTGSSKFIAFKRAQAKSLFRAIKQSINSTGELKGMPAYSGAVKNKVVVIKDQKDFYKMIKGRVLVAPNTRPEFLLVMKIAGAIITEEGGLTCHAAIVSRELKIPCIVGVQGVTSILKDGDSVKVDADKGVVKKL